MTHRFFPALVTVAVMASVSPAADWPAELRSIPPDAAAFLHLDVAALYDSKAGDALKKGKAGEAVLGLVPVAKMTGLTLADVKTVMTAFPSLQDQTAFTKNMSVVSFRRKYDREKLTAALKGTVKGEKTEFTAKDNMVRITTPSPFDPEKKTTTTYDLTDDTRIVTLLGLGDEYLKPGDTAGVHTATLKANPTAAVLAGLNFTALPDEIRGENLPAEVRPFRPILLADGLTAVGSIVKDKLNVTVTVKSKNKGDAGEVEKSLDALRGFAEMGITTVKKGLKDTVDKPKEIGELLDQIQAALKEAKFTVNDTVTSASLALPLDAPYGPFFDLLTGGGLSSRAVSSNNLKQMALAMHNYESAHNFLPASATLGKKGKKLLSWRVEILPYIEQDALYKLFRHDEPWDSEHNMKVFKDHPMPKVYAIPGTTNLDDKKTHYQVFVGNGAWFEPTGPTKFADVTDGTSNTFLIATAATAVEWTRPDDIEFDPKADMAKILLFKDGVTMVAFGDGSVRAISQKVTDKNLKAFITRNGGEVVTDDD